MRTVSPLTVLSQTKYGAARRRRRSNPDRVPAAALDDRVARREAAGDLPRPVPAERRRAASAPQDTAMYSCACGFLFPAAVTTAVTCPHCGDVQAW